MSTLEKARIDKWLWAVRLFKTRRLAAEACKSGRIKMAGTAVKAARTITAGDEFTVRKGPVVYHYRVLQPLEKRVGAPLVADYLEDITPASELEKLQAIKSMPTAFGARGEGRPTKKKRRDIDRWRDNEGS
jgi:ribosome-associated heat shock protein Hsp15